MRDGTGLEVYPAKATGWRDEVLSEHLTIAPKNHSTHRNSAPGWCVFPMLSEVFTRPH
jgi:hypothetical protein